MRWRRREAVDVVLPPVLPEDNAGERARLRRLTELPSGRYSNVGTHPLA